MERDEIRMRCLEAAQQATKTPSSVTTNPDVIVTWAKAFEAFVVGGPELSRVTAADVVGTVLPAAKATRAKASA